MNKLTKLNDVFANIPAQGIFTYLQTYAVPWQSESIHLSLNSEYHYNIAGNRFISPMVRKYLSDADTLTDLQLNEIAGIIYAMCGKRWSKLWDTLNFEYNPIQNYSMTELMRNNEKEIEYGSTNTRTPNITKTSTTELQGFNSSDYVPSDKFTDTETGTDTNARTGSDTETYKYDLTREGNIGVTTSQQMIQSERDLWVLWQYFYDVVFPDINRVLTLNIY